MTTIRTLTLAAAAFAIALPVAAQQPARGADFHWEKAMAAGSLIRLNNLNGDVVVTPSTSGKVEITGVRERSGDRAAHVEVHETSNGLIACVMFEDVDGSCDEDGYHIHNSGDGWGRHNDLSEMRLEVKVPTNVIVRASAVSGDVSVTGAHGELRVSSVSGDASVADAEGPLNISSVSGDVRIQRAKVTSLRVSTVSGDIDVRADAVTGTEDFSLRSVSGDIVLTLPRDFNADLSLSTVSGELDSEFPMTLNGRASRRRIEARIGQGGRELSVSTVSGDVRLRTGSSSSTGAR